MLRSIFSLFQNIIDSDREYNNKKSSTVIYLVSSPVDHKINMDLEIDGKCRKTMKTVEAVETTQPSNYFTITTDQGDAVTCKHATDNNIKAKKQIKKNKEATDTSTDEEVGDKPSFSYVNKESHIEDEKTETKSGETQGDVGINVRELLASLPLKKTPVLQKDKDQLGVLLDQIQKMKKGMERLHQIAKQFTCTDKFKQDVDLLMRNLSLQKPTDETTDNNKLSPSDP